MILEYFSIVKHEIGKRVRLEFGALRPFLGFQISLVKKNTFHIHGYSEIKLHSYGLDFQKHTNLILREFRRIDAMRKFSQNII